MSVSSIDCWRQSSSICCSPGTGTLITPIAPHSLSFRPLVVPESSEIVVQLPVSGPSHARCADGSSTLCKQACRCPITLRTKLWDADCLLSCGMKNQIRQGKWQRVPKDCKRAALAVTACQLNLIMQPDICILVQEWP